VDPLPGWMSLGFFVAVLCLSGARAKLWSGIFPFVSNSLMAAINSLGLSSFVRVIAASTKVHAWAYVCAVRTMLKLLVVYRLFVLTKLTTAFLVFFFSGEFSTPERSTVLALVVSSASFPKKDSWG
jgi:hypothetical protein